MNMNMLRHASLRRRLFSFPASTLTTRASSASSTIPATPAPSKPTVVVALSGGVDSSVTAALLKQRYGSNVVKAIHMSNWNATQNHDDSLQPCSSEQDWKDALAVSEHLQLPFTRHSFEAEYWTLVFEPYLNQLMESGKMGNPDMLCNRLVKFGALREFCLQRYGADSLLATGHYARLWHRDNNDNDNNNDNAKTTSPPPLDVQQALDRDADLADWLLQWGVDDGEGEGEASSNPQQQQQQQRPPILLSALDRTKDQSFFLAVCNADSLANVLFPLGDLYKSKREMPDGQQHDQQQQEQQTVRQLAADMKLPTASKRDSMGICFVGKRPTGFKHFLSDYFPPPLQQITFVDVDTGATVATSEHPQHAAFYTIGQGAKLSGAPQKCFIVGTDPPGPDNSEQNTVSTVKVCAGTLHPALYADSLMVDVHWMARNQPPAPLLKKGEMRAQCRIRHLQPLVDCTITTATATAGTCASTATATRDGTATTYQVHFDKPVRGIAPGQTAVFYVADGLVCLGGGPIVERGASYFERGVPLPMDKLHPSGDNDVSYMRMRQDDQDDDDDDDDKITV
jgi:tRNA U34 2-thiouridine synthase MnmA/TrmU